ncbi:MAG: hypothetical protein Q8Q02_09220 [Nocardioides sp.]|nr:hypothetical protein [Nocardioides sp.]
MHLLRTRARHRGAPARAPRRAVALVAALGILAAPLTMVTTASADDQGDPWTLTDQTYDLPADLGAASIRLAFGATEPDSAVGDGPRILAPSLTATEVTATHPATGEVVMLPAPGLALLTDGRVEDAGDGTPVRGQALVRPSFDAAGYEGWELTTDIGFDVEHPDSTITSHTHEATIRQFLRYEIPTVGTQYYQGGPQSLRIRPDAVPETVSADLADASLTAGCRQSAAVGALTPDGGGWLHRWTTWPEPEFRALGYAVCDFVQVTHRDAAGRRVSLGTLRLDFVPPGDPGPLVDDGEFEVEVGKTVRVPAFANDGPWRPFGSNGPGLFDPVGGGSPAGSGSDESELPDPRLTRISGLSHGTVFAIVPNNRMIYLDGDGAVTGQAIWANAFADGDLAYRGTTPGVDHVTYEVCSHYLPSLRCKTASFRVTVTSPNVPPAPDPDPTCETDPALCPAPDPDPEDEPDPVVGPDARNDDAVATVGVSRRVPVLANDVYTGDAAVSIVASSVPAGVQATVDARGRVAVTVPRRLAGREVRFRYRLVDETGLSDTATVTVTTPPIVVVGADRALAAGGPDDGGPPPVWPVSLLVLLGIGAAVLVATRRRKEEG